LKSQISRRKSQGMLRRGCSIALASTLMIGGPAGEAFAYLKFGTSVGGREVPLRWTSVPIRYYVNDQNVPGVSATEFQAALGRAFATWQNLPTASVSYQFAGFTSATPGQGDGMNTLGFRSAPDLDRVLAATSFIVDNVSGALLESDIFFNSAFLWSTSASGTAGRVDVESIALHEIGHLSGLGHSMIGETELQANGGRRVIAAEAVMFPIAYAAGSVTARTPRADDIAGMSDLYPDGAFSDSFGSLSGRVTKNGKGVFGAHVVAFNPASGVMVANFSLDTDGHFSIAGLAPGPYVVRAEPIDDASVDSYFAASSPADVDFRGLYFDRLVVVPRGGDSGAIEIKVAPK
jgi:carboxypeptidase family protein/matrixin